MNYSQELEKEL